MLSKSSKLSISDSRMVMLGERWERKGALRRNIIIVFSLRGSVLEMTIIRIGETREAVGESPGCIPAVNGHIFPPTLPPVQSFSLRDTGSPHSGLILSESNEVAPCHIPLETI